MLQKKVPTVRHCVANTFTNVNIQVLRLVDCLAWLWHSGAWVVTWVCVVVVLLVEEKREKKMSPQSEQVPRDFMEGCCQFRSPRG